MGKNITLKQLNESSTYDELYPAGAVDYTMLTETTSAAYGVENGSVKDALTGLYQYIHSSNVVTIKVVDVSNNPLPNITANGIIGSPQSGVDGVIKGVADSNSVTLVSPYVDTIKTKTVDVSKYKNTTRTLIVTMDSVADGAIVRYTSSQNVRFSNRVANIDVCCVGGGGGGGVTITPESGSYGYASGGGGGAINNSYGISVIYNQPYSIVIASGAAAYSGDQEHQTRGGTTTAFGISSQGGYSAYHLGSPNYDKKAGSAAMAGCGDGAQYGNGNPNNTISEFNDGVTFYSGGGASGTFRGGQSVFTGGSPNGANGAHAEYMNVTNASQAGIGGGGGGGSSYYAAGREYKGYASAGGPGLVAIKIHLKS